MNKVYIFYLYDFDYFWMLHADTGHAQFGTGSYKILLSDAMN